VQLAVATQLILIVNLPTGGVGARVQYLVGLVKKAGSGRLHGQCKLVGGVAMAQLVKFHLERNFLLDA